MAKIIDIIAFALTYFLVVYSLSSKVFVRPIALFFTLSTLLLLTLAFSIRIIKKKNKNMGADEMPVYLALMPRREQTELFYNLVPNDKRIWCETPYFCYYANDKKVLVAVLYRFLNLTQEDIANAYRKGESEKVDEIVMLTRGRDRKTLTLTYLLPIKYTFPNRYLVHSALKKHNALPPKPNKPKKAKQHLDLKLFTANLLSPKKSSIYLLTALSLALTSLITPLKWYYLTMATISLILGGAGLIRKIKFF